MIHSAGFAAEIGLMGGGIVRKIRIGVSNFDPDRLLRQLPGGFQIVRVELPGNDVIVRVNWRGLLPRDFNGILVTLVENPSEPDGGNGPPEIENNLNSLPHAAAA